MLGRGANGGATIPERHRCGPVAGSLVLGLLTLSSGLVWAASVSDASSALVTRTLDTRAAAVRDAAIDEIDRYSSALELVAAGLASGGRIDATAFEVASAPLDSIRLAGATSLAFIAAPVTDAGLDELEATWRSRGSTALELDPDPTKQTHVFAVLSRPLDGSEQRRTGVDVAAAPAAYAALVESRRTGAVSISDAYQLIIDQDLPESERQTSFAVTAPVMRQDQMLGWVLMGLRGQDFLGGVVERAAEGRVDVALLAGDTAGVDLAVASTSTGHSGAGSRSDRQRRTIVIPAAQQSWTLEVAASPSALIGDIRFRPLAVRVLSVVVALLVAGLWWAVTSSRARSRAEVRRATRGLAVAEEAARRQANMLQTMVETIEEVGVTVVDDDGTLLVRSRAARRILGIETESEAGSRLATGGGPKGVGDLDVGEPWQRHYSLFAVDGSPFAENELPLVRALGGESTDAVEMVVRNSVHPDGIHISVSGRPIVLGPGRTGALAVFRDVTLERRQRAEQAAFSGMVAHDLKNPLALVQGCLEIVDEDVAELVGPADRMSTVLTYLGKASAAAGRMAELIDDLLAYTSAEDAALDLRTVDLRVLVRDTLADVIAGHLAEREASGAASQQPLVHVGDLPAVRCDEERMRQVLGNLVGNALKYVAPGARPVVDVTAEVVNGTGVRIYVTDRGIGIPAELRAEVLKPFVRTPTTAADRANYPGTGLGLAICHRIIERHDGTLLLRPNPGGGTVAVIELPTAVVAERAQGSLQVADHGHLAGHAVRPTGCAPVPPVPTSHPG